MKDIRKDSYERLEHVQNAILEIQHFTLGISKNVFLEDSLISSGVLFQFGIIGEAIIHVETEILQKYDYPWFKVRAFRNLISHEYFQIKLEAVWGIVVNDVPKLKQVIAQILNNEF